MKDTDWERELELHTHMSEIGFERVWDNLENGAVPAPELGRLCVEGMQQLLFPPILPLDARGVPFDEDSTAPQMGKVSIIHHAPCPICHKRSGTCTHVTWGGSNG